MPSPPCRSLARLRGPLLWAALAAHAAGCGGPTGRDPVPHRGVPPGPVTTRQTSAQGLRVDRTRRPQGSLAVLLAVLPTEIAARPTRRAELSARALRLATGLAPIGGHAVAETLGGAPSIRIEAPVSRLADAALTLASELELPPPPPGAGVWVLGDALDALGALGAPDPQAPPVGRPYLVIVDTAESGGRDDRDAIDRLLKALAALPAAPRPAGPADHPSRPPGPIQIVRQGVKSARVALEWPLGNLNNDVLARGRAELLASVLARGADSRVGRAFGAAGLEQAEVEAELRVMEGGATALVLSAQVGPGDLDAAFKLILEAGPGPVMAPITSSELARARAARSDRLAFERLSGPELARRRALSLAIDPTGASEDEIDAALDAVTPDARLALGNGLLPESLRGAIATPIVDAGVDDRLWAESLAELVRAPATRAETASTRAGLYALGEALSVQVETRPTEPVVSFDLRIDGGARAEPPELPGVAALVAQVLGRAGESAAFPLEARLDSDALHLSLTVPAERWQEGLALLARRLSRWPTRPDTFEDARGAAQHTLADRQANHAALARALAEQAAADGALCRDPAGTLAGLADRTAVEARNFSEGLLGGRTLGFTVVGPEPDERLLAAVRTALSGLGRGRSAVPEATASFPRQPGTISARIERRTDGGPTAVAIAYPFADLQPQDRAAAEVLAAVVGPATLAVHPGRTWLVVTREGGDPTELEKAVVEAVTRAALSGPGESGLVRARAQVQGEVAAAADAAPGRAALLARAWQEGSPFSGDGGPDRLMQAIEAVSGPDVRALAARLPPLDGAIVAVVGPTAVTH